MRIILLLTFVLCGYCCRAQFGIYKEYSNFLDSVTDISFDISNGIYVCGMHNAEGTVVHLDSTGAFLWGKKFNQSPKFWPLTINQIDTNIIAIAGTNQYGGDYRLLHFDTLGNFLHGAQLNVASPPLYQGDEQKIISINDGAGGIYHIIGMESVHKTNKNGYTSWIKNLSTTDIRSRSVFMKNTNLYMVGEIDTKLFNVESSEIFIAKFDTSLNIQWAKSLGTESDDKVLNAVVTDDEDIIISGEILSSWSTTNNQFLLRVDSSGNQKSFVSADSSVIFTDLAIDSNNQIIASIRNNFTNELIFAEIDSKSCQFQSFQKFSGLSNNGVTKIKFDRNNQLVTSINASTFSRLTGLNIGSCINSVSIAPELMESRVISEDDLTITTITQIPQGSGVFSQPSSTHYAFIDSTCIDSCVTSAMFSFQSPVCVGSNVNFINNSVNANNYEWRMDDQVVSTIQSFSASINQPGWHKISLKSIGLQCVDSLVKHIYVDSVLSPDFSVSNKSLEFEFVASSFQFQTIWDFGDNSTNEYNVYDTIHHHYSDVGSYNVCMSQLNSCGTYSVCKQVEYNATSSYYYENKYYLYDSITGNTDINLVLKHATQKADGGYLIAGDDIDIVTPDGSFIGITDSLGIVKKLDYYSNHRMKFVREFSNGDIIGVGKGVTIIGMYIARITVLEDLSWIKKTATLSEPEKILDLHVKPNGNVILFVEDGPSLSSTDHVELMELDRNLNMVWRKEYPITDATNLVPLNDGFVFGGKLNPIGATLCRVDSVGGIIWAKEYTFSGYDHPKVIEKYDDKVYLVTDDNDDDWGIIKIDTSGTILSSHKYAFPNYQAWVPTVSQINFNGDLLVAANNIYGTDYSAMIRFDTSLNIVFGKEYLGRAFESIELTHDNGVNHD